MMLFPSRNSDDHCPRCNRIGAVILEHDQLGLVYECFHCVVATQYQGEIHRRHLTWAVVNGAKTEVIGA